MLKQRLAALIAEDAGNLSGMPKHAIKTAVKRGAGRKSEVEDSKSATSHHAMTKHLNAALKGSSAVEIRHNGKHVGMVHSKDDYTQKQKYGYKHHDGTVKSNTQTHRPMPSHYTNHDAYMSALKSHRKNPRTSTNSHYSKRDAIDHAIHAAHKHAGSDAYDKGSYKAHKFTVHAIKPDADRQAKQKARGTDPESRQRARHSHPNHPSKDAGLERNLDKAASKMASKRVAGSGAAKQAADHHEKIGGMIKAGDHSGAIKHLDNLRSHLSNAQRDGANHSSVKSDIKRIKSGNDWTRDSALKRLRKLNESPEMIEELSKKLLARYTRAASDDRTRNAVNSERTDSMNRDLYNSGGDHNDNQKIDQALYKKRKGLERREMNRKHGIRTAVKKLANTG